MPANGEWRRGWALAGGQAAGGAMAEVELSGRAYAKMALHAARHPAAAVSGLLLGRPAPPPARCLCLADCVPLFRAAPVLRPMLDVALHQVRTGRGPLG